MPILKEYVNDEGYYINARPSDVGNVTYQVDPSLWGFLEEMGYEHESEIEWSLVKSFRLAGLIYTEGSGVDDEIDEDIPELDPSKLSELTESELQEILDYIESRNDLDPELKRRIREYILQTRPGQTADLSSMIREATESALDSVETERNWMVSDISITEGKEQHWIVTEIDIEVKAWLPTPDGTDVLHHHFTNMKPVDEGVTDYVTRWDVQYYDDVSWKTTLDALQQKAVFAREIVKLLQNEGYELDDPRYSLSPGNNGFMRPRR